MDTSSIQPSPRKNRFHMEVGSFPGVALVIISFVGVVLWPWRLAEFQEIETYIREPLTKIDKASDYASTREEWEERRNAAAHVTEVRRYVIVALGSVCAGIPLLLVAFFLRRRERVYARISAVLIFQGCLEYCLLAVLRITEGRSVLGLAIPSSSTSGDSGWLTFSFIQMLCLNLPLFLSLFLLGLVKLDSSSEDIGIPPETVD